MFVSTETVLAFTGASVLRSRSLVMAQTCPIVSGVDGNGVYCLHYCLYALFYPDTVRQDCNVTSDPLVRNTCAIGECCLCVGTRQALLQGLLLCVCFVCLAKVPDLVCLHLRLRYFTHFKQHFQCGQ